MISSFIKFAGLALLASSLNFGTALAQTFPNKPLTMVVAFTPGGASDFIARVISKEMAVNLNQPVVVENVPGVGGSLGALKVANAAPDGYTLITGSPLELILAPLGIAAAKNKPEDVRMIAMGGRTSMVLVTRKDLGVNSVEELIALLKKSDKPLSYGSPGVGSLYHLMAAKMTQMVGGQSLHAPYPGIAQVVQAVAGGHLDFAFMPIAGPFPGFVDSGTVKGLAVSSTETLARLPKLPTMRSIKGFEDFIFSIWAGVQTGAKVPDSVAVVLHKSAYAALASPEVKKQIEASGTVLAAPMTLAELNAFYTREIAIYRAIAKSVNLEAQ
jgi:tripartite-type tricarboxylate transporter receptor subunit TctC